MEVLGRSFVPVDLVLANIVITHLSDGFERDVTNLRPGVSILHMSAFVEAGMFRIEMVSRHNSSSEAGSLSAGGALTEEGVVNAVMSALVKKKASAGAG